MNCDALIYFALDSSTWTTVLSNLRGQIEKPQILLWISMLKKGDILV